MFQAKVCSYLKTARRQRVENHNSIHIALVTLVAFEFFDVLVCLLFGLAALLLDDFT